MRVIFNEKEIENGSLVNKDIAQSEPIIGFLCDPNKLYTILMYDIDAKFLHWLVVNMNCSYNGDTVIKYMGPNPPSGIHRYYIYLYEQEGRIYPHIKNRTNFNISQFIHNDLNQVDQFLFKSK